MATKIQLRRGTAAEWTAASLVSPAVVLSAGEVGFETDTGKFKIGNGQSYWPQLSYASVLPADLASTLSAYATTSSLSSYATTTALSNHESDTTNIHGIADTSALATKTYADNAAATAAANLVASAPTALNTLDELAAALNDDANFAATITTALGNKQDKVSGVSDTEIGYLDGVTSSIQTQIDSKLSTSTAASTYQPIISGVSNTELGYLDGVTSSIQTQIDTKAPTASPTFTGTVSGITKSMVGLADVDNTSDANKPISTATQSALNAKLALSGGTMTGALTLSGAPTADLHPATKQYVDGLAAGINFHSPVVAATTGNLAGTYDNGTNGYLATLRKATNGSIGTIDGATVAVGNRILLRAQTDAKQNGIYVITAVGDASNPWVITRASDADNNPAGELTNGDFCFVTSGSTNISKGFVLSTTGTISIGTTDIVYSQFNASEAVTAGTGIIKNGTEISVDTSAIQARVANVSDTEIGYLDGVTSSIQTQLNNKLSSTSYTQSIHLGTNPGLGGSVTLQGGTVQLDGGYVGGKITLSSNMSYMYFGPLFEYAYGSIYLSDIIATKNKVSGVTQNQINFLSGVTSSIQTQLNSKTTTSYVDAAISGLSSSFSGQLGDYVPSADIGQALGVASLDSTGKVPASQLPATGGAEAAVHPFALI
jgi:hypothetical protein